MTTRNKTSASEKMLAGFTAIKPTVSERMAKGRLLRKEVPRNSHANITPSAQRPDPVALLETQARTRLSNFVQIRCARMLASPFAFLRGSAVVMAQDLSTTPKTGLLVEACGDMHLANFGVFASAERKLIFGINDFDETLPGAWEWDLKGLATSALVAGTTRTTCCHNAVFGENCQCILSEPTGIHTIGPEQSFLFGQIIPSERPVPDPEPASHYKKRSGDPALQANPVLAGAGGLSVGLPYFCLPLLLPNIMPPPRAGSSGFTAVSLESAMEAPALSPVSWRKL